MKIDTANIKHYSIQAKLAFELVFCMLISSLSGYGQVSSSIDSTAIKIGAELRYSIQVDSRYLCSSLVVFSEGQTFQPLEMINSYPVDTTKKERVLSG